MWLATTAVSKVPGELDGAVEVEAAVVIDVNVQGLEVGGGVDETDLAGLDEVVGDDDVLLVGSDLDVVGSDSRLVLVRVVKALDVVEIADVEGGNVVRRSEGQVDELAILGDVGAKECAH